MSRAPCSAYHAPIPPWTSERIKEAKRRDGAGDTTVKCPFCGQWYWPPINTTPWMDGGKPC